jgi:hypothetical protein
MSLISEALRKVQNQRSHSPELGSDDKNQSFNYTHRPNRTGLMIGLGVSIIVLIGLVAGLTVTLINRDKFQTVQKPVSDKSEIPTPEKVAQPSVPKPTTEAAKPEKPAAEPNQEIVDWLAQSKVTGIRITDSSSKVILNNDAFMPGDIVNMNLRLEILKIEEQRIILIDSNGVKYVKLL